MKRKSHLKDSNVKLEYCTTVWLCLFLVLVVAMHRVKKSKKKMEFVFANFMIKE
jgi:hypothetical protein